MTTDQKGAIAETAIIHAAVKLGISVLKPLSEGLRYDLAFDLKTHIIRVQCKWALQLGDVISIPLRSCRRSGDGFVRRLYGPGEIDAVAAYCYGTDRCYFLPIQRFRGRQAIQLRLAPTRNNQRRGVNWADDFEFAARLLREEDEGP
jgi:hypothetical protein